MYSFNAVHNLIIFHLKKIVRISCLIPQMIKLNSQVKEPGSEPTSNACEMPGVFMGDVGSKKTTMHAHHQLMHFRYRTEGENQRPGRWEWALRANRWEDWLEQ